MHTHQLCNVCERTPYWKCRIQGNIIHYGVVVSVLLTSCVKAISPPTHSLPPSLPPGVQTDSPFKMEKSKIQGHGGLWTAMPAALVA